MKTKYEPKPEHPANGTCDWGCEEIGIYALSVDSRWSPQHGWLSVCLRHRSLCGECELVTIEVFRAAEGEGERLRQERWGDDPPPSKSPDIRDRLFDAMFGALSNHCSHPAQDEP